MRVERIGNATLYLGDCLQILPTLPKVDAVITDPPYGIGGAPRRGGAIAGTLNYAVGGVNFSWDKIRDDSWIDLCGGPLAVFCSPSGMVAIASRMKADGLLVYVKTNPHPCGSSFEPCLTRGFGVGGKHIAAYNAENGQQHPTQKPISVMRFVVERITADTICDPFMGSGTTGVACMQLGRKFIGIEIEPKYFDIACERIGNAQRQGSLLDGYDQVARSYEQLGLV